MAPPAPTRRDLSEVGGKKKHKKIGSFSLIERV
jgi:hypothetical protein